MLLFDHFFVQVYALLKTDEETCGIMWQHINFMNLSVFQSAGACMLSININGWELRVELYMSCVKLSLNCHKGNSLL
jgi:hypothetical protein